ncbi:unnamed protein product [Caretta caretta]
MGGGETFPPIETPESQIGGKRCEAGSSLGLQSRSQGPRLESPAFLANSLSMPRDPCYHQAGLLAWNCHQNRVRLQVNGQVYAVGPDRQTHAQRRKLHPLSVTLSSQPTFSHEVPLPALCYCLLDAHGCPRFLPCSADPQSV